MGKAAIISIIAFSVFGSYYFMGSKESMQEATSRVAVHQLEVAARGAALAGYNQAKQHLAESFSATSMSGTYEGGSYSASVTIAGGTATIEAVGAVPDAYGHNVQYKVQGVFKQELGGLAAEPPPFMDYALLAEDDLHLQGNVLSEVLVVGEESNTLNANMHTNGSLSINGNAVDVQGFGTYVNTASASPSRALYNTFQPNYNPDGETSAQRVDRVDIPAWDMTTFLANVTPDRTDMSDVTLTGTINLGGTREDPYVWYVQGDVSATGGATVDGYVLMLVEGNVDVSGNLMVGNSGYNGPDESSVALYTSGNVDIHGTIEVYGQIFAQGNVVFGGTPRIYGSITTRGTADLSGTPKIYYRSASPALTTNWQGRPSQTVLAAYSEWPMQPALTQNVGDAGEGEG